MDRIEYVEAFFDTTVFSHDPLRKSAEFALIKRLSELGRLGLHLSQITRLEFVSQQEIHFDEQIAKLESTVVGMKRRLPVAELVPALEAEIVAIKSQRAFLAREFDAWLSGVGANVLGVAASHGINVVDRYFAGSPPFRRAKQRNDFPDAFIFECFRDVVAKSGVLHVVSGDKGMANAMGDVSGVAVYESIAGFIEGARLNELLTRTINLEAVVSQIEIDAKRKDMYLVSPILEGLLSTDASPVCEEYEFAVTGYGELSDLVLSGESAEDYGDGMFIVPFSGNSECLTECYMPKFEWHGMDAKDDRGSIEDWNDHVYRVERYQTLHFSGTLGFQLDLEYLHKEGALPTDIASAARNAVLTAQIETIRVVEDS